MPALAAGIRVQRQGFRPIMYRDANEIPATPGLIAILEIAPRRHGRACPGHPRL
jgi:hypothetical protein